MLKRLGIGQIALTLTQDKVFCLLMPSFHLDEVSESFSYEVKESESVSRSVSLTLRDSMVYPWNFPGKNTGVGRHSLLQGIFPTQGLNPGLLHCRQILHRLNHQGSPFSYGSPSKLASSPPSILGSQATILETADCIQYTVTFQCRSLEAEMQPFALDLFST